MKKILFLTLVIAVFTGALTSCGGEDLVYYGVVEHKSDYNIIGVNIPNVGFCEIPEAKKLNADINGRLSNISALEAGDLIKINFGKVSEVAVMECYPARFAASAEEITVYAKNIEVKFEYSGTTPTCKLTQPTPKGLEGAMLGDYVAFYEGGEDIDNVYCYGLVEDSPRDGKITLKLELVNGISEFLSKYPVSFNQKLVNIN